MPARPYFRLNPGDYLRDTQDLTLEEHGAYLMLICYAWEHDGVIPDDVRRISRILGVHTNRGGVLWGVLQRFWITDPHGFRHKRVTRELQYAAEISKKRAEAGRKGGQANAQAKDTDPKKPRDQDSSSRSSTTGDPISDQPESSREGRGGGASRSPPATPLNGALAHGVEEVFDLLREKTGRRFHVKRPDGKPTTGAQLVAKRLQAGHRVEDLCAVVAMKWREWGGTDLESNCTPGTLFGDRHFDDYLGALFDD